jgi:enamine deaminase RidA (YjgF/YER057c/UK114 family)
LPVEFNITWKRKNSESEVNFKWIRVRIENWLFSDGSGRRLRFVSGTTGYDHESMSISDNLVEQADQCFKNVEKALLEAGSSFDQVVRVYYIFPNKSDFEPC